MKTKDNPVSLIVCITGDIDDFQTETIECLDRYFAVLHNFNIKGTFFEERVVLSGGKNFEPFIRLCCYKPIIKTPYPKRRY